MINSTSSGGYSTWPVDGQGPSRTVFKDSGYGSEDYDDDIIPPQKNQGDRDKKILQEEMRVCNQILTVD